MPPARTSNPASFWTRWSAFVCLFAWFASVPSFLPLLVAALGSLDGQHRVSFSEHGGRVALVFGHATGRQSASHQHSPLAEMIAALAGEGDSSQDHIVTFGNTDAMCAAAPVVRPNAEVPPPVQHWIQISLPQTAEASGFAPRPPPTRALALVCLRSTTLLV